jgi:hypothetical protein
MSNHLVEIANVEILREEEELEGALLPVATEVISEFPQSATAAVPLTTFDYETAMAVEQEHIAYSIPQNERAAVADDSRTRVKLAERTGLIHSEEEREAIQLANRKVFSKDYHAREAVQKANEAAKQRDHFGLQMPAPPQPKEADSKRLACSEPKKEEGYKNGGGYAVEEYSFGTDYETNEYKPSEYKSVYD